MQCPRCGWQNPLDIAACLRCGLPVYFAAPPAGAGAPPAQAQPQPQPQPQPYGGYGQPAATPPPYGQGPPTRYQHGDAYGQPPSPYQQPFGDPGLAQTVPHGAAAPWPSRADTDRRSGRLARLLLALGLVASVVYAVWALTARRGIFNDFVHNRYVAIGDARTSDRVDTTLIVIAGALAVIALAWWLVRLVSGRSRSGRFTVAGFVVSGLGMVCVVVGLVLSGTIGDGGDRVTEGQRAVTATIVTASGFLVLAVGLAIGLVVVNARRAPEEERRREGSTTAVPSW